MAIWYIIEEERNIRALQDINIDGEAARALVLGDAALADTAARAFDAVSWIETEGALSEAFARDAAGLLVAAAPAMVLGVARPATRAILGTAAVKLNAAVAANVTGVVRDGDALTVTRGVYNDYLEVDRITGPAFLLVNPLSVSGDAPVLRESAAPVARADVVSDAFVRKTGEVEAEASREETAGYVVGLGFGARTADAFAAGQALATALGAEIGASMNLVENTPLLPGKRYIGLSGISIAPKLYVACGISGAAQHLAGIRNAKCVVVVNKDARAKFFDHADYGIVGAMEDVAPAIVRALEE